MNAETVSSMPWVVARADVAAAPLAEKAGSGRSGRSSLSGHQARQMKSDVWLTPKHILAPLGRFDLDPCSPADHPWQIAPRIFTVADDGLSQEWSGRVWLNPPFADEAAAWMRRMVAHGNGIALIAARTETRMFFECVWEAADAVCFLRSRPHFHRADGTRAKSNSGAPIVLVAYGEDNARFLERCGLGKTLRLRVGGGGAEQAGDGNRGTNEGPRSTTCA